MQHRRCNACGASAIPNAEQNPNPLYNRRKSARPWTTSWSSSSRQPARSGVSVRHNSKHPDRRSQRWKCILPAALHFISSNSILQSLPYHLLLLVLELAWHLPCSIIWTHTGWFSNAFKYNSAIISGLQKMFNIKKYGWIYTVSYELTSAARYFLACTRQMLYWEKNTRLTFILSGIYFFYSNFNTVITQVKNFFGF